MSFQKFYGAQLNTPYSTPRHAMPVLHQKASAEQGTGDSDSLSSARTAQGEASDLVQPNGKASDANHQLWDVRLQQMLIVERMKPPPSRLAAHK